MAIIKMFEIILVEFKFLVVTGSYGSRFVDLNEYIFSYKLETKHRTSYLPIVFVKQFFKIKTKDLYTKRDVSTFVQDLIAYK